MDEMTEQNSRRDGCTGQTTVASSENRLGFILDRLSRLLEDLGEGFLSERNRVTELGGRLTGERFHLAVLGQFKRGKTTLLNAFLGEPLLPTSVVPVTSVPTFLFPGPKRRVRVFLLNGKKIEFPDMSCEGAAEILSNYVTEERNPKNKLGVATVEVEHPSSFLSQGVVMIDTPGIGSTFRHNTEATLNFLPQCDAALFMVSVDPPITEVEVEFLRAVRNKVARLFFVMNKADYLGEDERIHALGFFKEILQAQVGFGEKEPVFCISARQGLQARAVEDKDLWQKSGLQELQACLAGFLTRDKRQTLQLALARKALDAVADTIMHIRLQHRSLQMPLDELEERIQIFDEKVREVEREKITMGDLLVGDRKRAVEFLEEKAEESRQKARSHLKAVASNALQKTDDLRMEQRVQACLAEAIPTFFEAELRSLSDAVDRRTQEGLRFYQDRADNLIETIRRTAAELFDIPYYAPDSGRALERTHKPYWVTYNWDASLGALPAKTIDHFIPAGIRMRRLKKRISEDIGALVVHNVENIRWATLRNLDDAFRLFSSTLDERLRETGEATRGAIQAALLRRKQQEETVQPELQRLKLKEAELVLLEGRLAKLTEPASQK